MKRVVERGLVRLAIQRTSGLGVCVVALGLALFMAGDELSGMFASHGLISWQADVHAGLARQTVWTLFLLIALPFLVARVAHKVAPSRNGDAPWLATRAESNASIATSTWLGASCASISVALVFMFVAELRAGGPVVLPVASGSLPLPERRQFAAESPLAWTVSVPDPSQESDTTMRIELGLGPGAGSACEVRLRMRRHVAGRNEDFVETDHIGNRGAIEVRLPRGVASLEAELSTSSDGARIYVLSERAELWSLEWNRYSASLALLTRVVTCSGVWIALALLFACFVSAPTAAFGVLALWVPLWFASGTLSPALVRWIPGADLFDALAVLGEGRAPARVGLECISSTIAIVASALCMTALALRSWRASR